MPTPFTSSGHPNGAGSAGAARNGARSGAAGNAALAIDNMLRNQLRVNDPRDPKQIAEGLATYYQDLPQTAAIGQEAAGLPFLQTRALPLAAPRQPTSSDAEFNIANGDVEKALRDLASNPLTNDITPEMQGWSDSIRVAIAESKAAAQAGLDPTNRDKVIAMRRQLGEYARMARFVGSLSPGMTQNFRRLGRGLDEVSAVLLVMLGESLASVGFATGYYLLQVPLPELQQRRDAVIFALRNFAGGAQQAYGPDDWPRGIDAYRRLYEWLERQGQGDLRSLLLENEVARTMDALITRAQNGTSDGLRALGVTAQLDIERFRRMIIVAPGALNGIGRSPPLETYLQALGLFAETFTPAGGLRLLRIARPPILLYGLYRTSQLEHDAALFALVMVRGTLATIADGLFPSNAARGVKPQILLDMLLFEFDRGIDLLALSSSEKDGGEPAWRAIAIWGIVQVILNVLTGRYTGRGDPAIWDPPEPITGGGPLFDPKFAGVLADIQDDFAKATKGVPGLSKSTKDYQRLDFAKIKELYANAKQKDSVNEELIVQLTLEERWEKLVSTIAIEAGDQSEVFKLLKNVILEAAHEITAPKLDKREFTELPPQYEQSLLTIARRV